MKVFISWSGDISHRIALILSNWLPLALQSLEPFVSSESIEKGDIWANRLSTELHKADFGIICITRENFEASWLVYEAGALANSFPGIRVSPFLFGMTPSQLSGPLTQFQATTRERSDVLKLLKSMNEATNDGKIKEQHLEKVFEKCWAELDDDLRKLEEETTPSTSRTESGAPDDTDLAKADKYAESGDLDNAERHFRRAIEFYKKEIDERLLARSLIGFGAVCIDKQRLDEAIIAFEEADRLNTSSKEKAEICLRQGICYRRKNELDLALKLLARADNISETDGDEVKRAEICIAMGDVHWNMEQWDQAEEYFSRSIRLSGEVLSREPKKQSAKIQRAQAQCALARVYLERDDLKSATKLLDDSLQFYNEIEHFRGIELSAQLLGRVHISDRDWEKAYHRLYESFFVTSITKNIPRRIETSYHIAYLTYLTNRFVPAMNVSIEGIEHARMIDLLNYCTLFSILCGDISTREPMDIAYATLSYRNSIFYALNGDPMLVHEAISRISRRLHDLCSEDKQPIAMDIVDRLIDSWTGSELNGKKVQDLEHEFQRKCSVRGQKEHSIARRLLDLRDLIKLCA